MGRTTLELLRTIVPGGVILLYIYLLLVTGSADTPLKDKTWFLIDRNLVLFVIAIILGYVYRALRMRDPLFKKPIINVQNNIKHRILDLYRGDAVIQDKADQLLAGRTLIEYFYKYVDRDPSLTDRANGVRANGLALSSSVDARIISAAACTLYLLITLVCLLCNWTLFNLSHLLLLALFSFVVATLSWILQTHFEERHLKLSNEQLDFIALVYRNELRNDLYNF